LLEEDLAELIESLKELDVLLKRYSAVIVEASYEIEIKVVAYQ
jgi:hypothetical protein